MIVQRDSHSVAMGWPWYFNETCMTFQTDTSMVWRPLEYSVPLNIESWPYHCSAMVQPRYLNCIQWDDRGIVIV